ncbi:light-harvesting complex-like protein 3 isotype 2, chloroplastic isoform X2 [Tasmannia lanceolata]|uniref:light-harvesting complex-like protein 3 isotype 2, chloroplastic isoform X2 n=1 Tax=Tasmannia lanceolata TaxID=3420 RepID=UPI004064719D
MGLHSFYPSLAQQKGAQQERTTPCTFMALNTIFASLQSACSSHHFLKKQQPVVRHGYSSRAKHTTHVITVEDQKQLDRPKKEGKPSSDHNVSEGTEGELVHRMDKGSSTAPRFKDERWKNGTWDLNLFVKDGKMDWDSVIVAARRRKFLQMYPEPATNEAQVLFRSSIIPWWAWLKRFHLPEAELLNGRAAMVGFFMAYFVDGLTGIGVVDQMSNSICKACLLTTVAGIILFRQTQNFGNLQSLINETTFYDKQWQASWQDSNASNTSKQDEESKN